MIAAGAGVVGGFIEVLGLRLRVSLRRDGPFWYAEAEGFPETTAAAGSPMAARARLAALLEPAVRRLPPGPPRHRTQ